MNNSAPARGRVLVWKKETNRYAFVGSDSSPAATASSAGSTPRTPLPSRVKEERLDPRRQGLHKRYPGPPLSPIALLAQLREANASPSSNTRRVGGTGQGGDAIKAHNTAIMNVAKAVQGDVGAGYAKGFTHGWNELVRSGASRSIPRTDRIKLIAIASAELAKHRSNEEERKRVWSEMKGLLLNVAGDEEGMGSIPKWSETESRRGRLGAERIVEVFEAIMKNEHIRLLEESKQQPRRPIAFRPELLNLGPAPPTTSETTLVSGRLFRAYVASRSLLHDPTIPFATVLPSLLHSRFPPILNFNDQSIFMLDLQKSPDDYTPEAIARVQAWTAQVALAQLWSKEGGNGIAVVRLALKTLRIGSPARTWTLWQTIVAGFSDSSGVKWIENGWEEGKGKYRIDELETLELERESLIPSFLTSAASTPESPASPPSTLDYTSPPARLTEAIVAPFLSGFTRAQLFTEAESIWTFLSTHSPPLTPGIVSWTALLQGYGMSRSPSIESVEQTWEEMKVNGVTPDVRSWWQRIAGYFNAKQSSQAMKLVDVMLKDRALLETDELKNGFPTSIYSNIVRALLKNNQIVIAEEVVRKIEGDGREVELEVMNAFLVHYSFGKHPDFPAMIRTLRSIQDSNSIKPDVFTFTIILQALLKSDQRDATKTLIRIMEKTGIKPSITTYGMIIGSLCKSDKEVDLVAAVELLDECESSKLGSNEIIYTSIIQGFLRAIRAPTSSSSPASRMISASTMKDESGLHPFFKAAITVKNRMEERGYMLNRVGTNAIIASALALQTRGGMEMAIQAFDELRKRKAVASISGSGAVRNSDGDSDNGKSGLGATVSDTWLVMITGFVDMGDWSRARKLVEQMNKEGFIVRSRNLKYMVDLVLRGGSRPS